MACTHSRSVAALALVVPLLLASQAHHADASILRMVANRAGNAVLALFAGSLSQLQPSTLKLIDGVAARRRQRGDQEGAARIVEMKRWLDYVGWDKGLYALGTQLFGARSGLGDAWNLVVGAGRTFQTRATEVGLGQAWQEQQPQLLQVVNVVSVKVLQSVKSGPVAEFFSDLSLEVQDKNLASDIMEELLPPAEKRQEMLASIKAFVEGLASTLQSAQARQPGSTGARPTSAPRKRPAAGRNGSYEEL